MRSAVAWARSRYERRPEPSRLLPEPFTLFKDTFRRRMEPQLQVTDEKRSGVGGPRAAMFRRSG